METNRRGFLQVAGLAALGLVVAKPATDLFSHMSSNTASSEGGFQADGENTLRLAMAIDIVKCQEQWANGTCTAASQKCQDACHSWHKVPDIPDREEEIKWIWKDTYGRVFEELLIEHVDEEDLAKKDLPVMLLCNHCDSPACIKYCPTRATWKRADGIVAIDFHRCIGCRYCMAGCPYGARSFNWRVPRPHINDVDPNSDFPSRTRGMVEKCNFCSDILVMDEKGNATTPPKCVEACPGNALIFGNLLNEESDVSKLLKSYDHVLRRLPELGTHPNNYYLLY